MAKKNKLGLIEKVADRAIESRTGKLIEYIRLGWNGYSFIFYIGSISVILGSLFGVAGWASIIVTIIFFYSAGKWKKHVDLAHERKERALHKRETAKARRTAWRRRKRG